MAATPARVAPLRPEDVDVSALVPDFVIETMNRLILKHVTITAQKKTARVTLREFKEELNRIHPKPYPAIWLDIESHYEKAGWKVRFERCTYGDSAFDSFYEFSQ